jgi:Icc-related predicted phosphoesterase
MRIVCISDTHGFHRKLEVPDADLLIHAGDFMVHGRTVDEIDDFNDWLGDLPHKQKIVIAGNHDLLFESNPQEAKLHLSSATYLENSAATVNGFRFWGCPITSVLSHMAFAVERGAASGLFWDRIPAETDVLVTHGPPFGILDKESILATHMGCERLTKAVLGISPLLHVFGHVHGGYGREAGPNGTRFVNCALFNGDGLRAPVVVDIDQKQNRMQ